MARTQRRHLGIWLGALLLALTMHNGQAAKIETLLMPGEVIAGHAKYESECTRCHARLSNTDQNSLCLDCHEKVAEDLRTGRGYHGRKPDLAKAECKACHTDHKGRSADIVRLNRDTFDHGATDFALKAGHKGLSCSSCHAADKKFRDAPSSCAGCHADQEPHKKRLGDDCADCHTERTWKDTRFDHGDTKFALRGAHREVICSACHPNQRYENTPSDCQACHALNDVHRGRNGRECADCHNEERWDRTDFDHGKDTKFALRGKHKSIACSACHTRAITEQKLKTSCVSCHRSDDSHHGRNGLECDQCHSSDSWTPARFDHDRKTDFPLLGHHRDLTCVSCHRGDLTDAIEAECIGCHRIDDVHRGKQGEDCGRCHSASGWNEKVVFDHDVTHFPLIGLHATAPCEECHISTSFAEAPKTCVECHKADDVHEQRLGAECARCHNPNGWALWEFDHDRATKFELEGAHQGLVCNACHRAPVKNNELRLARLCNGCHAVDDKHRGRFGKQCDRCHDQESFEHIRMAP